MMVKRVLILGLFLYGIPTTSLAAPVSASKVIVDTKKIKGNGWGRQTSLQHILNDTLSPLSDAIGTTSSAPSTWTGYVKESCVGGSDGIYVEAKDSLQLTFTPTNGTWGRWSSNVRFASFGRIDNGFNKPCTVTGTADGSTTGTYYIFHDMVVFYFLGEGGTYFNSWGGMISNLTGSTLTMFNSNGVEVVISRSSAQSTKKIK